MAFNVLRSGEETQVNSEGNDPQKVYQGDPSVTSLGDGRWVVTWDGYGPAGRGLYQQVYNSDGTPAFTQERRINVVEVASPSESERDSSVVAFEGGWLVTWARGYDEDIFVQRFDADGNPLFATEIKVNQSSIGDQVCPEITVLSDGWLVTWVDRYLGGVFQQRYDANGEAQYLDDQGKVVDRRISTLRRSEMGTQDAAAIDGGTAVVWSRQARNDAPHEIVLQVLDPNGTPIFATEHVIASGIAKYPMPQIKALGDGFLVVWAGADSNGQGVFLQKFNAQGEAQFTQPLKINTVETGDQHEPKVEVLPNGGWIVTYSSGYDVFQRLFDSNGNPIGLEMPVAAWLGSQWNREADVSYIGDGRWVAAWSNWNQGEDKQSGVAQRVFTLADAPVLTADAEVAFGTAGVEVDTLQVQAGGLSSGDRVDGGDGEDILEMIEAGTLDLRAPLEFRGFEAITGTGEEDTIITNVARLSGIESISGGGGNDTLELAGGGTFNLTDMAVNGIESITLTGASATLTVEDAATALLIHGDDFEEDKVVLSGVTLSEIQRYQLFRQGIETVKDASGTYVKGIGEILNLNGDQVIAPIGSIIRLDAGLDAEIPSAPPYYTQLIVKIANRVNSQDRLVISETPRVKIQDDAISVDGVWIGGITADGTGQAGLEIYLTAQATPARVQELVRALSYQNIATGTPVLGPRDINITLVDAGGSATWASVNVAISARAVNPTVLIYGRSVVEGADTGSLSAFAGVRIEDDSSSVKVTVTFDPTKGSLILGSKNVGTYDAAAGTYTIEGHPLDITDDLRALQFDPRDRSDAVGTIERTTFEIVATDSSGLLSEPKTITVEARTANRAPGKPTLSNSTVKELVEDGAAVGTVSGSDPNKGDAVTYSLVGAGDAPFRLDTQGGITWLVVTNGIRVDHEQRKDYTFTLRATDAQGLSNDTVVTIKVDDVNPERTSGSASNDMIKGGAGKDTIGGGLGDDKLFGALGNDVLTGGKGKDIFVFDTKTNKKTNVDKIGDFSVKDDSIWLDNAVFTKVGKGTELKPGKLAKDLFWTGKTAHDSSDRIVYDKATGALYYDQDGTGRGAQVKIATIKKGLPLTEKDFFVI
ncbi:cadherin domain-containing protein [Microvirga terrestris]|uniref:Cadherin domain-containing protein n=1 Tax=Microvirga terrestris TaxID=2791024 RepID=A0ABS0HXW5_9HYPH|nr:cadherin domain-containing protein [Microvirga terrestris]MBF9198189.1 cadherin domain-containing protein [Microvirga terrestris]